MLVYLLKQLTELIQEYNLSVDVMLVALNQNLANKMTRVLQMLLDMNKRGFEHVQQVYSASLDTMSPCQVMEVYQRFGHAGVRCTTYFGGRICPSVTKVTVKSGIGTCVECIKIYPAPLHWEKGRLGLNST